MSIIRWNLNKTTSILLDTSQIMMWNDLLTWTDENGTVWKGMKYLIWICPQNRGWPKENSVTRETGIEFSLWQVMLAIYHTECMLIF